MESSKQRKQNEEAERLARRNERNNKIQGVNRGDICLRMRQKDNAWSTRIARF